MAKSRSSSLAIDLALALLVVVLIGAGWFLLAARRGGSGQGAEQEPATAASDGHEQQIRAFCSACHLFPPPAILPRSVWRYEVELMYKLAGAAKKKITGIPPIEKTLLYYLRAAPEALPAPKTYLHAGPGPLRFRPIRFRPPGTPTTPAVSYLKYAPFLDGARKQLIACDMRSGLVTLQEPSRPDRPLQILARLAHPAHVEVVDLDRDGLRDLLVAELGSFLPMDGDRGKALWLRRRPDGSLQTIPLLEHIGRVADVQAGDLDGDGDLDLAVAAFGWRSTGKIVLLFNRGKDENGLPRFEDETLDPRPGAIHVPIIDLDQDGRLDIVALVSQHFETVEAYLADGEGWFRKKTIYRAPHPDWGSSGIEVVDLDADGDLDVVLVNGDSLDNTLVKPRQGVYWLENRGSFPFAVKRLASLVGAMKVRAADLDGDGDLDLAACSFLPQLREEGARVVGLLDSVLWIEQVARGRFVPHSIQSVACDHAALEVGDFDGDGDPDVVVGNFVMQPQPGGADWLTFFANPGRR